MAPKNKRANKKEIEEEEQSKSQQEEQEEEEQIEDNDSIQEEEENGEEEDEINEQPEEEAEEPEEEPITKGNNVDIGDINIQIQKILEIFTDFTNKKEEGKTRNTYMNELKVLTRQYYDYNEEICDLILNLFAPNEAIAFMDANNEQRIVTIRTNTIKTKRRELAKNLMQRGVNLEPLAEWSKVGLKVFDSQVPIGATPEYLAGQYMLQSASSFLPVLALDPQPGEKILDMCAAPGGKTTYIAQLMKNKGFLVANDMKKERLKSLFFNVHRLGITNTIITNYDGRELTKIYNSFDRILLDAPCSGLGVIAKDQSVKVNRTYKEILNNSRVQKELLLAAIDSCNIKGTSKGIVVYSTCSIAVEENEWVVDYALRNRYVKCIELGFASEVGADGFVSYREKHFHPNLKHSKRIYPHTDHMDGFYVAKLQKYADGPKIKETNEKETEGKDKKKRNKHKKQKLNKEEEDAQPDLEDEDIEDEGEIKPTKKKSTKKDDEDDEKDDIYDDEDEVEHDEEDDEDIKKKSKHHKKDKKQKSSGKGDKKVVAKSDNKKPVKKTEQEVPFTLLNKKRKNK